MARRLVPCLFLKSKIMKNKKIEFQKLVDKTCPYSPSERLQIIEWFFKTGAEYDVSLGRWHLEGVDSLLYNYSANNHVSYTRIESWSQVYAMFINAIVVTTCIQKWRDDFGIKLGNKRFLNFKGGENDFLFFNKKGLFDTLESLKGKPLKKEFFHPDYPDRLSPYIKDIFFTISVYGCYIKLEYTFDVEGYENNGWIKEFYKKNSSPDSLELFLENTFKTIDTLLVSPQIFLDTGKNDNDKNAEINLESPTL
jgi:hypothetical protein